MSKSGKITNGPFWSQNWFEAMWRFTCNNFVNFDTGAVDFEALGREEYEFRKALFFRNFKNSKRARTVFDEAKAEYDKKVENGMKGGRPKKNTEGAPNGNNVDESTTAFENLGSAKPSTDGGTRKDPLNMTTVRKNGKLESGTSVENICGSANTQAASNTGNVKPVTCRESGILSDVKAKKPLAGGMLPSSSLNGSPARSGAVDVLNLAYAGEFGNVRLTQEQYAQLGIKFGNQLKLNRAIDSLSCQIENGEKNPQNHYAELVKWANYRDDMEERKEEEASKPKMTEMEKSWIEAMKRVEAM